MPAWPRRGRRPVRHAGRPPIRADKLSSSQPTARTPETYGGRPPRSGANVGSGPQAPCQCCLLPPLPGSPQRKCEVELGCGTPCQKNGGDGDVAGEPHLVLSCSGKRRLDGVAGVVCKRTQRHRGSELSPPATCAPPAKSRRHARAQRCVFGERALAQTRPFVCTPRCASKAACLKFYVVVTTSFAHEDQRICCERVRNLPSSRLNASEAKL